MAMKIQIDRIPEEGIDIDVEEPVDGYDIGPELAKFASPISIKAHADYISGQLVVMGAVETAIRGECSRCLKQFDTRISIDEYVYDFPASQSDIIDLTDNIREYIILALPMKSVCSEGCKGLCPVCGKDLNTTSCGCSKKKKGPLSEGLDKLKF